MAMVVAALLAGAIPRAAGAEDDVPAPAAAKDGGTVAAATTADEAAAAPGAPDTASAAPPATADWSRYRWQQELIDPPGPRLLFKVAVPPEVYDGSTDPLRDLRILGAKGRSWPLYVWTPGEEPQRTTATGTILNRYTLDGNPPRRVVEVDAGPGGDPHSRIRVETSGRDFVRRVQVSGSRDRREWARLGEGWLVDNARPPSVRNDVIRFPESDFRYLKVEIWPNARDRRDALSVTNVSVYRTLHEDDGEWREVALEPLPSPAGERGNADATLHLYDAGADNRPLRRLTLRVADPEFARPVRVWGRSASEDEWTFVSGGEIHRYGDEENLTIELRGFEYRFARVEISHFDDEPLRVLGATGFERVTYVVAESRGDAPAYLVYGQTPPVEEPRFDLRERTGAPAAAAAIVVKLGPREPNDRHHDFPGDWTPWIAGGAIAVVSLILVWVIAGMVRRAGSAGAR